MTFEDLARERYVSLTTFKQDGTAVSTPVWVAGEDGQLLVWTAADSWKVRCIKRDGHVRIAPCNARGKPRGEALDGMATVLPESSHVEELEGEKYGWRMTALGTLTRVGRFIKREPTPESVTLTITPELMTAHRRPARTRWPRPRPGSDGSRAGPTSHDSRKRSRSVTWAFVNEERRRRDRLSHDRRPRHLPRRPADRRARRPRRALSRPAATAAGSPGSASTARRRRSSPRSRASSGCTSWPSRTPSRRTSARSSSATATRCSASCAPRATSTRPRRSSSARCTSSPGPHFVITVRHGEAPDLGARAARARGAARPAAPGPGGDPARDHGPRRRRLRARRRRRRERHRRDRGRGLRRQRRDVSRRIYELTREVIAFQRATKPLAAMLAR